MNAMSGADLRERLPLVVTAIAVVIGVVLRFVLADSPLWLDEAQTLAVIADGYGSVGAHLRGDGHPPLYYWLLLAWTDVIGDGDIAARSLSAVLGLAALPLVAITAKRVGGANLVVPTLALAASSPFMVRYATEVRMYSLVIVLSLAWWLLGRGAVERPTAGRLAGVAITTAALLLTHYWAAFLVAAGCVLIALVHRSEHHRAGTRSVVVAGLVGSLVFVPWLPSLVTQIRHTGTPWAVNRNPVSSFVTGVSEFAGGREAGHAIALFGVLLILLTLGLLGTRRDRWTIELDLRLVPAVRPVALLVGLAMAGGLGAAAILGSAFAGRYFSIVVAFVLVLAGRGVAQIGDPVIRAGVLAAAVGLGVLGSLDQVRDDRSQGQQVAEVVADNDRGPDIVVVCPDQLGPAIARYLPEDVEIVAYPTLEPAGRVDWTDYEERNAAADPAVIADMIDTRWPDAPVWLAIFGGYRTFGYQCERLATELAARRGPAPTVVVANDDVFEPMNLISFSAPMS
ncbi:MAG: glycosyltransferase family 39 protein [Acidimicrobiales bacterium]